MVLNLLDTNTQLAQQSLAQVAPFIPQELGNLALTAAYPVRVPQLGEEMIVQKLAGPKIAARHGVQIQIDLLLQLLQDLKNKLPSTDKTINSHILSSSLNQIIAVVQDTLSTIARSARDAQLIDFGDEKVNTSPQLYTSSASLLKDFVIEPGTTGDLIEFDSNEQRSIAHLVDVRSQSISDGPPNDTSCIRSDNEVQLDEQIATPPSSEPPSPEPPSPLEPTDDHLGAQDLFESWEERDFMQKMHFNQYGRTPNVFHHGIKHTSKALPPLAYRRILIQGLPTETTIKDVLDSVCCGMVESAVLINALNKVQTLQTKTAMVTFVYCVAALNYMNFYKQHSPRILGKRASVQYIQTSSYPASPELVRGAQKLGETRCLFFGGPKTNNKLTPRSLQIIQERLEYVRQFIEYEEYDEKKGVFLLRLTSMALAKALIIYFRTKIHRTSINYRPDPCSLAAGEPAETIDKILAEMESES